jgi:hypothetical protein
VDSNSDLGQGVTDVDHMSCESMISNACRFAPLRPCCCNHPVFQPCSSSSGIPVALMRMHSSVAEDMTLHVVAHSRWTTSEIHPRRWQWLERLYLFIPRPGSGGGGWHGKHTCSKHLPLHEHALRRRRCGDPDLASVEHRVQSRQQVLSGKLCLLDERVQRDGAGLQHQCLM